jgi:hydrogenase/urease accessory protein HupE
LLIPTAAAAHLVTTGMGPVYDGIGHLLLTPEDLVPAVAVALYAGLRGRGPGRQVLFLLPLAWLAGGIAGLAAADTVLFLLSPFSFLILGALIAADLRLPAQVVGGLAVVVGIIHGYGNGMAMAAGPGVPGLFGIMAVLFVLAALVSAVIVSLKPPWTRIAVRVLGSWVAAMGILMTGWFVRSGMV